MGPNHRQHALHIKEWDTSEFTDDDVATACPREEVLVELRDRYMKKNLLVLACPDRAVARTSLLAIKKEPDGTWLEIEENFITAPQRRERPGYKYVSQFRTTEEKRSEPPPKNDDADTSDNKSKKPDNANEGENSGPPGPERSDDGSKPDTGESPEQESGEIWLPTLDRLAETEHDYTHLTIIIWAMSADAARILSFLRDMGHVGHLSERLGARKMKVVLASHYEQLPVNELDRKKLRELRDVHRQIEEIGDLVPPVTKEQVYQVMTALFQRFSDRATLLEFAKSQLPWSRWNFLPKDERVGVLAGEVVAFLAKEGVLSQPTLLDSLAAQWTSPECAAEIEHCRALLARLYGHEPQLKRLEKRQAELQNWAQDKHRELTALMLGIDAIDAILLDCVNDGRLSQDLRLKFEEQRKKGDWGESEFDVVRELRRSIHKNELEFRIKSYDRSDSNPPSLQRLMMFSPAECVALFVAAFLQHLDPDEFEAVVQHLLIREQTYLEKYNFESWTEMTVSGPTGPDSRCEVPPSRPRTLTEIWAAESDIILDRCGIQAEHHASELSLGWSIPRHGTQWKRILSQHRHYFVARQLDHLKNSEFLTINIPTPEPVFKKILQLQVGQARLSPLRRVSGWLEILSGVVPKLLARLKALESSRGTGSLASATIPYATLEGRICSLASATIPYATLEGRILNILTAIHDVQPADKVIDKFFARLNNKPINKRVAVRLCSLLDNIEGFDLYHWLMKFYGKDTQWSVLEVILSRSLEGRLETAHLAWAAVSGWLAQAKDDPDEGRLGFDAAMGILLASTWDSSNHVLEAFYSWIDSDENCKIPEPLNWLFSPHFATMYEAEHAWNTDLITWSILGRRDLGGLIYRDLLQALRDREWRELDEETVRRWYPMLLAGILVQWNRCWNAADFAAGSFDELVRRLLKGTRLPELAVSLCGILGAFGDVLRSERTRIVTGDLLLPRQDLNEPMLAAIQSVQGPLEAYIAETGVGNHV